MATERDFELLDDYVANRLPGEERSAFEKRLQSDPDLRSEFQIQQRLVKAIKDMRVSELKTMLNNTPVAPVKYGTSIGAKLALGTVVAGLIATGIYLYTDKDETSVTTTETTEQETNITDSTQPAANEPSDEVSADDASTQVETSGEKPGVKAESRPEATERNEQSERMPDVYDPSTESEEETEVEEAAGDRRSSARAGAPSIVVEIDNDNRKYNFDYQFKNGKLYLFGVDKNLYEVLEFFTDEKRTAFLYYKKNFYLLNDGTDQVQELTVVTDPELVRKLKEYRGN